MRTLWFVRCVSDRSKRKPLMAAGTRTIIASRAADAIAEHHPSANIGVKDPIGAKAQSHHLPLVLSAILQCPHSTVRRNRARANSSRVTAAFRMTVKTKPEKPCLSTPALGWCRHSMLQPQGKNS
jgi:hypothetical protein